MTAWDYGVAVFLGLLFGLVIWIIEMALVGILAIFGAAVNPIGWQMLIVPVICFVGATTIILLYDNDAKGL